MSETDAALATEAFARAGVTVGSPLSWVAETGSTSDDAKAGSRAGAPHGALWVADAQTAGRGRQGRAWLALPGDALLFSVLLRLPCPPARLPLLALAAGLAVRDGIAAVAPELDAERDRASDDGVPRGAPTALIKWPNDVLVGGRKVSGVLVEGSSSGGHASLVVGIGVNVATRAFPPELESRATSLALATGRAIGRVDLLAAILERLQTFAPLVTARGLAPIHERLRRFDALFGRTVTSELGTGLASGIDRDGRLLVRSPDGNTVPWSAGEVHIGTALP